MTPTWTTKKKLSQKPNQTKANNNTKMGSRQLKPDRTLEIIAHMNFSRKKNVVQLTRRSIKIKKE
jgi:hypothetical protein